MGKEIFDNIIIAVDLDGTFLNDEHKIPKRNLEAIDEFCEGGGLFTIATGRATPYTRTIISGLELSIPAVVYNGGTIYDFKHENVLWRRTLPLTAREYKLDFYDKFPTLGVEMMCGENIYYISSNRQLERHSSNIGVPLQKRNVEDIPFENLDKMLLIDEIENTDNLCKYASTLKLDGIHVTRSSPYFFEILPANSNKGEGLRKLIDICGFNNHYIVAAGDYNNDIEMMQVADLAVAVENAQDEVKKHADIIVCDNNSGAVYDIVEYLKSHPNLK